MARFGTLGTQYFTDDNVVLGGGSVTFYDPGTTTLKATYSDSALTIQNTNPVLLDAAGRLPNVFFSGLAKAVLKDSEGEIIETRDPVGDFSAGDKSFSTWSADVEYPVNAVVAASDGYFYVSLVNNNIANDPSGESSPSEWELFAKSIGIPDAPNGSVLTIDTSKPLKIGSVTKESLQSLIFIETATINNAATVDFTDLDVYSQYLFVFKNIYPATNSVGLNMRTSSDNGVNFDSGVNNYLGGESSYILVTGTLEDTSNGTSAVIVGTTTALANAFGVGYSGQLMITRQASEQTSFVFNGGFTTSSGGGNAINQGFGYRDSTTQINAVRFFASAGNISTGSISVYGVRT